MWGLQHREVVAGHLVNGDAADNGATARSGIANLRGEQVHGCLDRLDPVSVHRPARDPAECVVVVLAVAPGVAVYAYLWTMLP